MTDFRFEPAVPISRPLRSPSTRAFEGLSSFWASLGHDFSVVHRPKKTLAPFTGIFGMPSPGSQCRLSAFHSLTALKVTCSVALFSTKLVGGICSDKNNVSRHLFNAAILAATCVTLWRRSHSHRRIFFSPPGGHIRLSLLSPSKTIVLTKTM